MLIRILVVGVFVLGVTVTLIGQENRKELRHDEASSRAVLLLLAAQQDCPLRLERARFVQSEGGSRWGATYGVHNEGSKPIRSFSTMIVSSFGTGGTMDHFDTATRGLLMPGQSIDPINGKNAVIANSLSKHDVSDSRIKIIAVLMVGKIVFADGSIYDGEPTYRALQDYFQELDLQAKP